MGAPVTQRHYLGVGIGTFILCKGFHAHYGCLWGVSFGHLALNAWGVGVVICHKDSICTVLGFVR